MTGPIDYSYSAFKNLGEGTLKLPDLADVNRERPEGNATSATTAFSKEEAEKEKPTRKPEGPLLHAVGPSRVSEVELDPRARAFDAVLEIETGERRLVPQPTLNKAAQRAAVQRAQETITQLVFGQMVLQWVNENRGLSTLLLASTSTMVSYMLLADDIATGLADFIIPDTVGPNLFGFALVAGVAMLGDTWARMAPDRMGELAFLPEPAPETA
jgi:hypothetical protein